MSLVAYAASDDSDASDTEQTEDDNQSNNRIRPRPTANVPATENHATQNSVDHTVTPGQISDSDSDTHDDSVLPRQDMQEDEAPVYSLLKGLPAPKSCSTETTVFAEDDELEDEVKPKLSQIAEIPHPPKHKKGKQPVRITIPALQYDSDEEKEPAKKKARTVNSTKCGLTALLPAPVHTAKKEINRTLLPYTLSKKKLNSETNPKTSTAKSKEKNIVVETKPTMKILAGYDSESEEEEGEDTDQPINFFSLGSSADLGTETPSVPLPPVSSSLGSRLKLPAPKFGAEGDSSTENVTWTAPEVSSQLVGTGMSSVIASQPDPNAPLSFSSGVAGVSFPYSQAHSYTMPTLGQQPSSSESPDTGPYPQEGYSFGQYEDGVDDADPPLPQHESMDQSGYQEVGQYMQDEEFLKMQGKKSRGKEEINIVDVNADDFMNTVDLAKHMSEETADRSHRKKDGPSSQQKRKKQITYLAFQAKERELDLKNQWAQNRTTKRATQSKYGF